MSGPRVVNLTLSSKRPGFNAIYANFENGQLLGPLRT
jgi:hypothetical protein